MVYVPALPSCAVKQGKSWTGQATCIGVHVRLVGMPRGVFGVPINHLCSTRTPMPANDTFNAVAITAASPKYSRLEQPP